MVLSGTAASSTTKTGRHDDIAEILLKVALNTTINKSINQLFLLRYIYEHQLQPIEEVLLRQEEEEDHEVN